MTIVNSITQGVSYIYQGASDYCKDIPKNTPKIMVEAFAIGSIIEIVVEGSLKKGALAGGLCLLCTAIYGIVTPLFKMYKGPQHTHLSSGEEICRTFTAMIGGGAIAAAFGTVSGLQSQLIFIFVLNLFGLKSRTEINSTHRTCLFLNFPKV